MKHHPIAFYGRVSAVTRDEPRRWIFPILSLQLFAYPLLFPVKDCMNAFSPTVKNTRFFKRANVTHFFCQPSLSAGVPPVLSLLHCCASCVPFAPRNAESKKQLLLMMWAELLLGCFKASLILCCALEKLAKEPILLPFLVISIIVTYLVQLLVLSKASKLLKQR